MSEARLGPYILGPNDTPENGIYQGDARILSEAIPDDSVDLIFTDPPYKGECLYLFEWLGQIAARVLKLDGLLITLTGNNYFDEVFSYLNEHLNFYWIGGMKHATGTVSRYHPKQIMCGWKPTLWFAKNGYRKHPYVFDMFQGRGRDKHFHKWGQDAPWCCYYLDKLTTNTDNILDPFTGGGTVPAVCKGLGRHWLAFEIEPETVQLARKRVAETPRPLFTLQPQQMEMVI